MKMIFKDLVTSLILSIKCVLLLLLTLLLETNVENRIAYQCNLLIYSFRLLLCISICSCVHIQVVNILKLLMYLACTTRVFHSFQGLLSSSFYHVHIVSSLQTMVCTSIEVVEYLLLPLLH